MNLSERVSKGICVVDFYTDHCVPCKFLFETLNRVKEKFGDKFELIKINAEENPDLSQEFQISSVPSLFIYKDGELKDSIFGNVPQLKIEEKIANLF